MIQSNDSATTSPGSSPFSEKDFYLAEFRGRSIALALDRADSDGLAQLSGVLAELAANGTRVALLSPDRALLEKLVAGAVVREAPDGAKGDSSWIGGLWRLLRAGSTAGLVLSGEGSFAGACREVVHRLRLAKLVWIAPGGGLRQPDGDRISYVDLAELEEILALGGEAGMRPEQRALLREFHAMVAGGLPAVNLCSLEGLSQELFSYAGSGTLFTRERYTTVRRLSLDEFDAANHLISRGVEEGYLTPRGSEDIDRVLAHAFGVFIEGRYLAGIGALLPSRDGLSAEVVSLYTLTRFLKEGVGAHLVGFALDWARELGVDYAFACTTSERVVAFFERHGFEQVDPDQIPAEKWQGYPEERRDSVRCLRCRLGPGD